MKFYRELTYINEAMSTSYTLSSCKKTLMKRFSTIENIQAVWQISSFYKNEDVKLGDFKIKLKDLSELEELIPVLEESYGWFTKCLTVDGHTFIDWNRTFDFVDSDDIYIDDWMDENPPSKNPNIAGIFLYVEAKFTVKCNNWKNLYHLTDSKNLPKIKLNGLVPKTKGNFPDRVYFSKSIQEISDLMIDRHEHPIILKLNSEDYYEELKAKYKFYIDPRLPDYAVFTYDCIDPKYLEVLQGEKWEKLL